MTRFEKYQQALINYIDGLDEGEGALKFLDGLCFAEADGYGEMCCDICGHPLKYALVLKANYIAQVGIFPDYENDVVIGRHCFAKLTKLAWLKANLENQYNEWKTCIAALRDENKSLAKGIMLSVKEAKERLREVRHQQGIIKLKERLAKIQKQHEDNLADEGYRYLFEKYGRMTIGNYDEVEYSRPMIDSGNDFLDDLFARFPDHSEKQNDWFRRLIDKDKFQATSEYQHNQQINEDYIKKVQTLLHNVRLGRFDSGFVRSLADRRIAYSEKQMLAIDKLCYRYRRQMDAVQQKDCVA